MIAARYARILLATPGLLACAASVSTQEGACEWRFNVGDFVVNRNNGMELGVVVRREPRHRFPNGEVRCAYFMRTGPGPDLSKWDAAAIDRIGTRP